MFINKKILALTLMVIAVSMFPIYAVSTISGTVTSGGSSLNDAKVTAEQKKNGLFDSPEYEWTRTDTNGDYSLTVDADETYDVSAMKGAYDYLEQDETATTSNADFSLSTRLYEDMVVWVVADDGFQDDHPSWETDAQTLAYEAAEGWFDEEHSIDIIDTTQSGYGTYDNSPNSDSDCLSWADQAKTDLSWSSTNNRGAKIAIVVAGDDVSFNNGDDGCISGTNGVPTQSGEYPLIVVTDGFGDPGLLSMHEIGHAYSLTHSNADWKHAMIETLSDPDAIKNFKPADDDTIESNRDWYN